MSQYFARDYSGEPFVLSGSATGLSLLLYLPFAFRDQRHE